DVILAAVELVVEHGAVGRDRDQRAVVEECLVERAGATGRPHEGRRTVVTRVMTIVRAVSASSVDAGRIRVVARRRATRADRETNGDGHRVNERWRDQSHRASEVIRGRWRGRRGHRSVWTHTMPRPGTFSDKPGRSWRRPTGGHRRIRRT